MDGPVERLAQGQQSGRGRGAAGSGGTLAGWARSPCAAPSSSTASGVPPGRARTRRLLLQG